MADNNLTTLSKYVDTVNKGFVEISQQVIEAGKETQRLSTGIVNSFEKMSASSAKYNKGLADIFTQTQGLFDLIKKLDAEQAKNGINIATPTVQEGVKEGVASSVTKGIVDGTKKGSADGQRQLEGFFSNFFGRMGGNYVTVVGQAIKYYKNQLVWYATKNLSTATLALPSSVITAFTELNQGMKDIGSVAQLTDTQMQGLANTMLNVATTTKFSISEVSSATLELAKAGLSLKEINESLEGLARLATATGSDITQASGLVVTALRAFDISSNQTAKVVDYMSNAVVNSRLDIEALSTGFSYIASSAAQAGIPLEEVVAQLGILANSGLRASTAATGMRMALLKLIAPSSEVQKVLSTYGITLDDVNPRLHSMADILDKLKNISQGDLVKIFTVRSANSIIALANAGGDALRSMENAVLQTGTTSRLAEEQLLGLQQAWKNLNDTLETTYAGIGQQFGAAINDVLRGLQIFLVQNKDSIVAFSKAIIDLGIILIKYVAVPLAMAKGVGILIKALTSLGPQLTTIGYLFKYVFGANTQMLLTILRSKFLEFITIFKGFTTALGPIGTAIAVTLGVIASAFALAKANSIKLHGTFKNYVTASLVEQEKIAVNINRLLQERLILEGRLNAAISANNPTSKEFALFDLEQNVKETEKYFNAMFKEGNLSNQATFDKFKELLSEKYAETFTGSLADVAKKLAPMVKNNDDTRQIQQIMDKALLDTASNIKVFNPASNKIFPKAINLSSYITQYKELLILKEKLNTTLKSDESLNDPMGMEKLNKDLAKTDEQIFRLQKLFVANEDILRKELGITGLELATTINQSVDLSKKAVIDISQEYNSLAPKLEEANSKIDDSLLAFSKIFEYNGQKIVTLSEGTFDHLKETYAGFPKLLKEMADREAAILEARKDTNNAQFKEEADLMLRGISQTRRRITEALASQKNAKLVVIDSEVENMLSTDKTKKLDKNLNLIKSTNIVIAQYKNQLKELGKEDALNNSLEVLKTKSLETQAAIWSLSTELALLESKLALAKTDSIQAPEITHLMERAIADKRAQLDALNLDSQATEIAKKIKQGGENIAAIMQDEITKQTKNILPDSLTSAIRNMFNAASTVTDAETSKFISIMQGSSSKLKKALIDQLSLSPEQTKLFSTLDSGFLKDLVSKGATFGQIIKQIDKDETKGYQSLVAMQKKLQSKDYTANLQKFLNVNGVTLEEYKSALQDLIDKTSGIRDKINDLVEEISKQRTEAEEKLTDLNFANIFSDTTSATQIEADISASFAKVKEAVAKGLNELKIDATKKQTALEAIKGVVNFTELKDALRKSQTSDVGSLVERSIRSVIITPLETVNSEYRNIATKTFGDAIQVANLEGIATIRAITDLQAKLQGILDKGVTPEEAMVVKEGLRILKEATDNANKVVGLNILNAETTLAQNLLDMKTSLYEQGLLNRKSVIDRELELLEKQQEKELLLAEQTGVSKSDIGKKYADKRKRLEEEANSDIKAGLTRGLSDWVKTNLEVNNSYTRSIELTKQTMDAVSSSMADALISVADGTSSVSSAFKTMASSIVNTVAKMMVQQGVAQLLGLIAKSALPTTSGSLSGNITMSNIGITEELVADWPSFANGTSRLSGGFKAFANGGSIISKPTLGLVGEGRYNEAIIPLPDGKNVPVVMRNGDNANPVNVSVNVINQGSQQVSATTSTPRFDGEKYIIDVILKDYANYGRTRQILGR